MSALICVIKLTNRLRSVLIQTPSTLIPLVCEMKQIYIILKAYDTGLLILLQILDFIVDFDFNWWVSLTPLWIVKIYRTSSCVFVFSTVSV